MTRHQTRFACLSRHVWNAYSGVCKCCAGTCFQSFDIFGFSELVDSMEIVTCTTLSVTTVGIPNVESYHSHGSHSLKVHICRNSTLDQNKCSAVVPATPQTSSSSRRFLRRPLALEAACCSLQCCVCRQAGRCGILYEANVRAHAYFASLSCKVCHVRVNSQTHSLSSSVSAGTVTSAVRIHCLLLQEDHANNARVL